MIFRRDTTNEQPNNEAGYGKPPKHTQFEKGHSGNPKGRPKRSPDLTKSLNETVTITENGHRKTITKFNAIMKQLVNKAAAGDPRAMRQDETDVPARQPLIIKISEVDNRL